MTADRALRYFKCVLFFQKYLKLISCSYKKLYLYDICFSCKVQTSSEATQQHSKNQRKSRITLNQQRTTQGNRRHVVVSAALGDLRSIAELSFQHHRSRHAGHRPPQPPPEPLNSPPAPPITVCYHYETRRKGKASALRPQEKVAAYMKYKAVPCGS